MFLVTIFAGVPWKLLFKTEEGAKKAFEALTAHDTNNAQIEDDFGSTFCTANISGIAAIVLEDLSKSIMAQVELGLHQARAQAKAQTMAIADPTISAAIRAQGMGGGPAVYRPGMA